MAAPAALLPPGGGLPPQQHRSFVEALTSPLPPHLNPSANKLFPSADHHPSTAMTLPSDAHRMGSHKGSPAIYFKPSHIQNIVQPYHWSLIGKFTHGFNKQNPSLGRPPVEDLVLYFKALDLKSEVQLGLLDNRHVLIQIQHYDDFLRLYSRPVWYVKGKPMRIFKWTSSFHVDREAPFAPVWISFPRLPIHFFEKLTLMAIASLLGTPLRLDAPTLALTRPSIARVQVEIDLLKPRVEKLWIGVDEGEGFWQKIEYADVPEFCPHCNHVGHSDVQCHVRNPDLKVTAPRKTSEPLRPSQDKKQQQRFVPTGRQADPSGFFAVADTHPSTSDATTVAPSPAPDSSIASVPQPSAIIPPQSQNPGVQPAPVRVTLSPEEGVPEQLASTDVDDASVDTPRPSIIPPTVRGGVHLHGTVDEQLHGTVHQQCPSDMVHGSVPSPVSTIAEEAFPHVQEAAQQLQQSQRLEAVDVPINNPPEVSASLDLVLVPSVVPPLGLTQLEVSPPVTTSNVLYKAINSLEDVTAPVTCGVVSTSLPVASPVPTKDHVPATVLTPYAPTFHSPTPSEAYGSKSPILQPPILPTLPSQQKVHTFMGHDMGYNDSDYYQDSFGADEFGFEDEGATDEYTYDDITDGSEGAHSRKQKDRRKLKGSSSNISATKEELNEQSRLLGIRIRNRGRPPGSRNRTYFGTVRTMETRASKSISN